MGREIVKQKSSKDPGRRSRLWNPKEVYQVLKYNKVSIKTISYENAVNI
jgi:leucine-rich repeat protein SHOC2